MIELCGHVTVLPGLYLTCGSGNNVKRYLTGWRCAIHTPAARAGHREPGWSGDPIPPRYAPAPQSASTYLDDKAFASGKRRSSPARYREAQTRLHLTPGA